MGYAFEGTTPSQQGIIPRTRAARPTPTAHFGLPSGSLGHFVDGDLNHEEGMCYIASINAEKFTSSPYSFSTSGNVVFGFHVLSRVILIRLAGGGVE
jgi:hypothetical protein